jgi:CelD/BcsL family acetyltransferase involved in cellulose biosynthesis
MRLQVARTVEELERLRALWERVDWDGIEAEYELFLARAAARPNVLAPFAAFACRDEIPLAAVVGRFESRRLETSVGYRVLYAPEVRLLQIVDGGIAVAETEALEPLLGELRSLLAGEVDAIAVPPLPEGSELAGAFASLGSRQRLIRPWTHRRLVLPASFEQFLASRSPNTRWRIRRDARRLEAAFGDAVSVAILRERADLERIVHDTERIAAATYQRALGAGFADTPEQRAFLDVGLEHGWIRAYLLYCGEEPVAYWLCSLHRGTLLIRTTGFDDAYAELRAGLYLLARVVEDACADPEIRILDFGPGDAAYKLQFGSEDWRERNLLVFARTFRARRINLVRTAILGSTGLARRAVDAAGLTDRIKSGWRGRLRSRR